MVLRRRVVEHCVGLPGKGRPEIHRVRVGIEKAREIGLNAVQGFLEVGAGKHAAKLELARLILVDGAIARVRLSREA